MSESPPLFLFHHVPKTGGQSLRNFFIEKLQLHREFIHLGPYGYRQEKRLGLVGFAQRRLVERGRARVILGHDVTSQTHRLVPGRPSRYALFLRDPADRTVSHYNSEMARRRRRQGLPALPFEEWYAKLGRDFMSYWLRDHFFGEERAGLALRRGRALVAALDRALQELWFVGTTESLDDDAPALLRQIGLRGVPERANVTLAPQISLNEELRQRLYDDNALDLELHRRWRDRRRASRARLESGEPCRS